MSSSHQLVLQSRLYLQHYLPASLHCSCELCLSSYCCTDNNACTGGCGLCHVTITVAVFPGYINEIHIIILSRDILGLDAANALLHSLTASGRVPSSSSSLPQLSPVAMLKLVVSPLLVTWCEHGHTVSQLVILYFISYTMLGYVTHCNYLPWT